MNDSEVEELLRTTNAPERPEAYWENFAGGVMRSLPRRRAPAKDSWLGPIAWGSALAAACVMIGFGIGQTDRQLATNLLRRERNFRREALAAPRRWCAMIDGERRLQYLVADMP